MRTRKEVYDKHKSCPTLHKKTGIAKDQYSGHYYSIYTCYKCKYMIDERQIRE